MDQTPSRTRHNDNSNQQPAHTGQAGREPVQNTRLGYGIGIHSFIGGRRGTSDCALQPKKKPKLQGQHGKSIKTFWLNSLLMESPNQGKTLLL